MPTCDEFYLAHALDDYREIAKQACLFRPSPRSMAAALPSHWSAQVARQEDAERIRQGSEDFFDRLEERIDAAEVYLTMRGEVCAGFGLLERSRLYGDVASIGMFTIGEHRRAGVGTATITLLLDECRKRELRAVAGCWYYNHASRRTLERAGMYSPTRLLSVSY